MDIKKDEYIINNRSTEKLEKPKFLEILRQNIKSIKGNNK